MELEKNDTDEMERKKNRPLDWLEQRDRKEKKEKPNVEKKEERSNDTRRRNVRSSEEERDGKGYCAAIAARARTLFLSVDRDIRANPVSVLNRCEERSLVVIGARMGKFIQVHRCAAF